MSGVVSRACRAETIGPFRLGSVVGGTYEVRHILGAGGMGVVYDALDGGLVRRVALKAAISSVFAEALHTKAHALAALRSPSFVEVYALASHEGTDFIVMERLYGERLDRRIDDAIENQTTVSRRAPSSSLGRRRSDRSSSGSLDIRRRTTSCSSVRSACTTSSRRTRRSS